MKSMHDSSHPGIQTCHLCGKVQCGQRLGRVKCCYCSRIFCLQQLQRKFGIVAVANDPCFKCPRCTGICCCMCNCQRPPPHVHCKVYKVRQSKMKALDHFAPGEAEGEKNGGTRSDVSNKPETSSMVVKQEKAKIPPIKPDVSPTFPTNGALVKESFQSTEDSTGGGFKREPYFRNEEASLRSAPETCFSRIPSLSLLDSMSCFPGHEESFSAFPPAWQEPSSAWPFNHSDSPGSTFIAQSLLEVQNSDWLTQLNLTILDNVGETTNMGSSAIQDLSHVPNSNVVDSSMSFLDLLRFYFDHYGDPSDYTRANLISSF